MPYAEDSTLSTDGMASTTANPNPPPAAATVGIGLNDSSSDDNKGAPVLPAQVGAAYREGPPRPAVAATAQRGPKNAPSDDDDDDDRAPVPPAQDNGTYERMDAASGSVDAPLPQPKIDALHNQMEEDEKKVRKRAKRRINTGRSLGDRSRGLTSSMVEERIARKMSSMDGSAKPAERPATMSDDARARLPSYEGRVTEASRGSIGDHSVRPTNIVLEEHIARKTPSIDDSAKSAKWSPGGEDRGGSAKRPPGGDPPRATMSDEARARLRSFEGRVTGTTRDSVGDHSRQLTHNVLEERISNKISSMDDSAKSAKRPSGGDTASGNISDDARARLRRFERSVVEATRGSVGDRSRGLTNSVLEERMARKLVGKKNIGESLKRPLGTVMEDDAPRDEGVDTTAYQTMQRFEERMSIKMASMDSSGYSAKRRQGEDLSIAIMADDARACPQRFDERVTEVICGSARDHSGRLEHVKEKLSGEEDRGGSAKRPPGGDSPRATLSDDARARLRSFKERLAEAADGSAGDRLRGLDNSVLEERISSKMSSMDGSVKSATRPPGGNLSRATLSNDARARLRSYKKHLTEAAHGYAGDHLRELDNSVLEERISSKMSSMDDGVKSAKRPSCEDSDLGTMSDDARARLRRFEGRVSESTRGSVGDPSRQLANKMLEERITAKLSSEDDRGGSSERPPSGDSANAAMSDDARSRLRSFEGRVTESTRGSVGDPSRQLANKMLEECITAKLPSEDDRGGSSERPPSGDSAHTTMSDDARARLRSFEGRVTESTRGSAGDHSRGLANGVLGERVTGELSSDEGGSAERPPGGDSPSPPTQAAALPLLVEQDSAKHQAPSLSEVTLASSSPPLDHGQRSSGVRVEPQIPVSITPSPQTTPPFPSEFTNAARAYVSTIRRDPSVPMLEATAVADEVYDAVPIPVEPVEQKTCWQKNQKFVFGSLGLLLGLAVAVAVGVSLSSSTNTSVEDSNGGFAQPQVPLLDPTFQQSESSSPSQAPSFHPTLGPSFRPSTHDDTSTSNLFGSQVSNTSFQEHFDAELALDWGNAKWYGDDLKLQANQGWVSFGEVNFGDPGQITVLRLRYSSYSNSNGAGNLRVRLGSKDAAEFTSFQLWNTNSFDEYVEVDLPIEVDGVHELFFTAHRFAGTHYMVCIDWFELLPTPDYPPYQRLQASKPMSWKLKEFSSYAGISPHRNNYASYWPVNFGNVGETNGLRVCYAMPDQSSTSGASLKVRLGDKDGPVIATFDKKTADWTNCLEQTSGPIEGIEGLQTVTFTTDRFAGTHKVVNLFWFEPIFMGTETTP